MSKPIGRRPRKAPSNAAEIIRDAASKGASQKAIAFLFRCHPSSLRQWMEDDPKLQEAMDEGRESERRTLHNRVFEIATKGSGKEALIAAFFLLKARHGYRDNAPDTGTGNSVSVNFAIPGPQPFDPSKVIEHEPAHPTQLISATPFERA